MRRAEIVTVAPPGDYGKPRPAIVIQTDILDQTDSVLVCLLANVAQLHRLLALVLGLAG